MKKNMYFFLSVFISLSTVLMAGIPTPYKLPVTTVIGTDISVDYNNGSSSSTTVNTKQNAFDGDLTTFFASYVRSGGWVGLDLGDTHLITSVAYCPRAAHTERLELGVIEGANKPDFSDALPLCIIKNTPADKVLTHQTITCSRAFRYVRYVGPNDKRCNIAELEFYGYESDGDDSFLPQLTNLPTVSIKTVNAEDIVSKEVYLRGVLTIVSENGTSFFQDSTEVRGRGNNSWTHPKKPYRIKLLEKASLLGFPAKEKSWTLINNYGDKTLMRNLLGFDLSKRMDMPYTPAGALVDVVLNGEYKGTYQLCDQVQAKKKRVEIESMKVSDISGEKLTGGYLLEIDAYAHEELPIVKFTSKKNGTPVTIKSPDDDEIVQEQRSYIIDHFNKMEASVFASNYTNPTEGYRKFIHTPTFIRHFLISEFAGNTDTYWSVYTYKKRSDDLFYFGPIWDLDLAYENDRRTYPINSNSQWIYQSKGSAVNGMRELVNRLLADPSFFAEVKDIYAQYRDAGLLTEQELLAVVDNYAAEVDASQQLNFKRWNILNQKVHENPVFYGSYQGEVNNVKQYITNRIAWMDNKLSYVPKPSAITDATTEQVQFAGGKSAIYFSNVNQAVLVKIIDVSGRLILSQNLDANGVIAIASGTYVVQIVSENGSTFVSKCLVW